MRTSIAGLAVVMAACGTDYKSVPPTAPDAATSSLRFYEDVAPILASQCVTCHRLGGGAPFALITYDDVVAASPLIPSQIMSRKMPPYNADASGACNTFQNARYLTDAQIATIVDWLASERTAGDPADAPPLPPPLAMLPRIDAAAVMATPYTPDATMPDDYRCFIIDPGIATDTYMTGFQVRPGDTDEVHHMLLYQLADAAAETTAANLDAQSPGPGYTCFGGPGAAASLLAVWAPGIAASTYPTNTGLPVKGARKMILQVHYHPHAAPSPDQSSVGLMLQTSVSNPASLFLMVDTNLNLPPQQSAVTVTGELALPGFVGKYNVWGVFPHMHTLGRKLHLELDHAGTTQCLIDVPRWDFNWQQGYFYDGAPLAAGGGDTLRIACTYDTTARATTTTFGEGTADEMCLAFVYVSPQ
jgi:mono/diheme cytochrome c family protein